MQERHCGTVAPSLAVTIAIVLQILSITFPFFALVLCGFVAARRRLLPLEAVTGLNSFVLFFALPCMLYRFGSSTPVVQLLDVGVLFTWLVCALITVSFTVAVSLSRRIGWNDGAFGALVAAFPNTGFMGVPLLVALLGPRAAGPIILTMLIDMVITTSLCLALSRLDGAGAQGASKAATNALKAAATNPLAWSILLGAAASAMTLELPEPVLRVVGLLADAASPVALFTIGAVLARSQMMALANNHAPIPLRDYLPVAAIKLLLHPLLVLVVGANAIRFGLPMQPVVLLVLVLAAALPSASNVSLLAERFGADNGRIARIILVSTAAAFVSFSLLAALLT